MSPELPPPKFDLMSGLDQSFASCLSLDDSDIMHSSYLGVERKSLPKQQSGSSLRSHQSASDLHSSLLRPPLAAISPNSRDYSMDKSLDKSQDRSTFDMSCRSDDVLSPTSDTERSTPTGTLDTTVWPSHGTI